MSKENKTLFNNTQVIIMSTTVLILGIGILYVFGNRSNEDHIATDETEVQDSVVADEEISGAERELDGVSNVQTNASKSYTYEQRTAIDDQIFYIHTGQQDYLAPSAQFDEENGVVMVGIVGVDYSVDLLLSKEGDAEHLQNWQDHISNLSKWSREFAKAGQDYEMEMHVIGKEEDDKLLFIFENGELLYDVLSDGEQ